MKICKDCNAEFEPRTAYNSTIKQKYCDVCTKTRIALKNLANIKKEKKAKAKESLLSLSDHLKLTQAVFNKYIRLRDKGLNCISCGKKPKKENAGHYFSSGGHSNVRFDKYNVHLQCEHCNTFLSGNLIEYGINLEKKIGIEEFIMLRERAYEVKKWAKHELEEIRETYKRKIKEFTTHKPI
jgi:hypothetical protein